MMQKPGDRRLSDRDLFLPESVFEFGQRDVRLLSYQLPHQILMRRQREIFVAAEFGRLDAARLPVKLEEADDRTDADAALLRSFRDGGPALNRPDHSPTQILRIRLRHACWPPPSRHLESCSRRYGNPRVSLLGKRSKMAFLFRGGDARRVDRGSCRDHSEYETPINHELAPFGNGSTPTTSSGFPASIATKSAFVIWTEPAMNGPTTDKLQRFPIGDIESYWTITNRRLHESRLEFGSEGLQDDDLCVD